MTEKIKQTVLIVDDQDSIRRQLASLLEDDYTIIQASSRREALATIERKKVDVVICDLHMPPNEDDITEGLGVLEGVSKFNSLIPVIVVTGDDSRNAAMEVAKRSAYAPLSKPFTPTEIEIMVRNAAQRHELHDEIRALQEELRRLRQGEGGIVGSTPALRRILDQARAVAETSATVLITGESGTGKEVMARHIHNVSPRKDGPFIACNIAALPETLVESELFGHEKGSFTGANTRREGRFELANKGTLFLDEIGELAPAMQVKLLRVLQERQFERIGGKELLTVDIRVIAATNRNLEDMVDNGQFRADLYYRLNIVNLELPPLRGRQEDIPILARHFIRKMATKHDKTEPAMSPEFEQKIIDYNWPGNIRQLENIIERAVVISSGPVLGLDSLPDKIRGFEEAPPPVVTRDCFPIKPGVSFDEAITELKRYLIGQTLRDCHGSRTEAAGRLGISRQYLQKLLRELAITE